MSQTTIGSAVARVDGFDKLTGRARYAADFHPEGMAHAYGVYSTISRGKIVSIDTSIADDMPGVIEIFHHANFPTLHRSPASFPEENMVDELRTPFEDDVVHYAGQFVALVVADTFEHARDAAYRVKVSYDADSAAANLAQGLEGGVTEANRTERGDADSAFDSAEVQVDATYTTPVETHNPMEMHATTARWAGGKLIVHESTQGVIFARNTLAKNFDLDPSQIEVHADYIGSGFGGKLWLWPHSLATCAVARELGRPVQFMLPRQNMFTTSGHRPETSQHIQLGAKTDGTLTSIIHDSINSTSSINTFVEACGGSTSSLYASDALRVSHGTAQVARGTPTPMRAPGAGVGLFALESAMDELAIALDMDPLELRRQNFTATDPNDGKPWSSNHMLECYDRAAERFGWADRNSQVGSMRDGDWLIGQGVAACNWDAMRNPCDARVTLRPDGSATVHCATQDIGTGTYTIIAQTAADTLGIDIGRIHVAIGDSTFPHGQISGGSWATASILPAIVGACKAAADKLVEYAANDGAPMAGADSDDLLFEAGVVKNGRGDQATPADILEPQKLAHAIGDFHSDGSPEDGYAYGSFGVHFVEIGWNPNTAQLKVRRVVSSIDAGAIMNDATARSQVEGAIVMGLGAALFEATEYDERTGRPVNNNYAEYLVPVNADMPELDVILLNHPDYHLNELGARGIGEIGLTGVQAAVANAVYHATGKRIRDLPITLDKIMDETA